MCGILAAYRRRESSGLDRGCFEGMLDTLCSRGPDERAVFEDHEVLLGHTRLSIIDLAGGSQPVFNEDRTVACVLNGEIYNFRELRSALERMGHRFRSRSDTEVVVHLYEEKGEDLFAELNGMFALVVFDLKTRTLLVGRDRFGEKPVLYADSPELFACASELKALLRYPGLTRSVDLSAVAAYLNLLYVPAPLSIMQGVKKLDPAHYLRVTQEQTEKVCYWQPNTQVDRSLTEADAVAGIVKHLRDAVQQRTVADVPLGVFLSGGLDSSSVVALLAQGADRPIKTFSVGFEGGVSELSYARQVAERYKTDHTEIHVAPKISDVVMEVARYYDEPFADNSNVPTFLIARAAREHVKVILTGDGGDEMLGGYGAYLRHRYDSPSRVLTRVLRAVDQLAMGFYGRTVLDRSYFLQPSHGSSERWLRTRRMFSDSELGRLCRFRIPDIDEVLGFRWLRVPSDDPLSAAFGHDLNLYLPDDILKKVDMASMACGLETRAPFLDHRFVEFALRIPPMLKIKNQQTKHLLRKAMNDYLPPSVIGREKQGFGAPIGAWLRGDLRPMVDHFLGKRCRVADLLVPHEIDAMIRSVYEDRGGGWRRDHRLWSVLMLELWMRDYA